MNNNIHIITTRHRRYKLNRINKYLSKFSLTHLDNAIKNSKFSHIFISKLWCYMC